MAFFKSKAEKEIEGQMERDEKMELFNEQISNLKVKRAEYAKIAAEAEINGDTAVYDTACNALIELNDMISSLLQTKANFDIINVSNSIVKSMSTAIYALEVMANRGTNSPDIKQIQKVNAKLSKYMRNIKISNKAMASAMKNSNPANHARSESEMSAIRPMIEAEISKMTQFNTPKSAGIDLSAEIEAEKKRTV